MGHGCLHRACGAGGLLSTVALLVDAGADVNMVDSDNRTPLTMAARALRLDLVRHVTRRRKKGGINLY